MIGATRNKRVMQLSNIEHIKIASMLSLPVTGVSRVATSSKRCFVNVGYDGLILNKDESIIAIDKDGNEFVLQAKDFICVKCNEQECKIVVKGVPYPFIENDRGQVDVHYWSGLPKAKLHPDEEIVFLSASQVKRKVMLFKYSDTCSIVVDHTRKLKSVPYNIIVPVYPEKDDMIMIQGESKDDIWHGKVLTVDFANKTVDVYFFVKSRQNPDKFVRELFSRQARNTVSFDSIISIANGQWIGANTWQTE